MLVQFKTGNHGDNQLQLCIASIRYSVGARWELEIRKLF